MNVFLFNCAEQNCLKELVTAKLCTGNILKLSGCRNRFLVTGPVVNIQKQIFGCGASCGKLFCSSSWKVPFLVQTFNATYFSKNCLSSKVSVRSGSEQLLLHKWVHLTMLLPSSPTFDDQGRLQIQESS